jgi:hypothetical protein
MKSLKLGELTFEIVHRPLETLTKELMEEYKTASVPAARNGFGNPNITESDIELHVLKSNTTIFVRDVSGSILGFSSSDIINVNGTPIIYLQGTAISRTDQGKGIYNVFNPLRIVCEMDGLGLTEAYVGTRTQSPITFWNMVKKFEMFPRPKQETPEEIGKIAESLAQDLYDNHSDFQHPGGLTFNPKTLVHKMAYGNMVNGVPTGFCMYGNNIPWVKEDQEINDFLRANVDFQNGDAMILLGKVDYSMPASMLTNIGISIPDGDK